MASFSGRFASRSIPSTFAERRAFTAAGTFDCGILAAALRRCGRSTLPGGVPHGHGSGPLTRSGCYYVSASVRKPPDNMLAPRLRSARQRSHTLIAPKLRDVRPIARTSEKERTSIPARLPGRIPQKEQARALATPAMIYHE
jgi:hypothetical protein